MASSSKKPAKGRGGSSSGKGGSSIAGGARTPRDPGDNSSSSDSVLGITGVSWGHWEWLVIREDAAADVAWTPNFREIRDLQIQRNEMLVVPLVFDFQCSRAIEWADWIDLELADRGFCNRLEQASVLHSILISRLYWRKEHCSGDPAARFKPWIEHFNRKTDPLIRRAAFVAYWLSKCVFGEHPAYSIKPLYFPLAVKIAARELAGASCHIVTTAFNSSIVHTFLWEHALEYIKKGRKPYEARNKFASMPEGVVTNVGDFQGDMPAVYRWVGSKFYDHSLIPFLDSESKVCWRPYGVSHRGFVYESVMSGFSNIEAQDYTLIVGDMASLTYLSATNAGWLPVLSFDGLRFTVYSAHRVRKQFGFDQEIPAVMGVAAVIIPSGDRVGVYTTGMSNYWRGLMAAMVEFRNSGRGDISHLLESYTSPTSSSSLCSWLSNTMTTYANRQSLGYAVWHHEESQWVVYGNHHPPLWLRDHPHVAAPGKVPSSRGRRTASAGTPAAKGKQSSKSKKREAPSKDSPAQASKRMKTTAGRVSKEVLVPKTAVQDPLPAGEIAAQWVSAPVSKKAVRKTRAGKRTFVPPAFPSAPSSIAARVAARKSSRGVVYSEKRSKQRADTVARVPIEIPDDLSSSSSSSDKDDPSGAAAEEIESDDTEIAAAEIVSGADDFAADISLADIGSIDTDAILNASSGDKGVEAGTSAEDDEVSMDELKAAEAAFDSDPTAFASNPKSAEGVVEEHATVGVVTSAERVVEITPITVTSNGGTAQGGPSGSGSHMDPSLLDSSPSARQYVRRARRGNLVSTDSERTVSATVRVSTPSSPLPESGGTAPTPITTAAVVSVAAIAQENETALAAAGEVSGNEEVPAHIPEVPEDMTHVEHAEVAASEEPVQADVTPGNAHDSYDEVLAEAEDNMAGAQAADMEVTAPAAAHTSPTKTAGSGNETVAEEEGRLQTAAVESAVRGQPGLLSAARLTLKSSEYPRRNSVLESLVGKVRQHTRLEDITEVHILEWKAVVQEAIEGGFKFGFILDYLRRLAHDIFSRRVLAELRVAEARVAALRDALNTVAPNPWDLASARRVYAEAHAESALQGLLS
uniref:Uncharacterized protein n=1 Tax=Fagus sylvatica TaxID=28930 RepID=A0A2N9G5C2_FAGSY